MSTAAFLAAAAAGAGVLGAWDCLATAEGARVADRLVLALAPLVRARHEGRAPSGAERRRLGLLAAGALLAGGWILGGPFLGALMALAGPAAVLVVVRARRERYREEVGRGAAGAARALADAIGAGHSIRGALAETSLALPGAAGHELRIAARALAFGEPTEAVLERLRVRAGCRAWDTLVAAILLQRDAGGDLPALLRDLAAALEAAERLARDARTATAQARFTAWLVVALPVAAAALAELAAPGFLAALIAAPLPAALSLCALLLQAIGLVAIHRIVRVRRP
jgi:tight adherence protein B